jgi:hypothetical protein
VSHRFVRSRLLICDKQGDIADVKRTLPTDDLRAWKCKYFLSYICFHYGPYLSQRYLNGCSGGSGNGVSVFPFRSFRSIFPHRHSVFGVQKPYQHRPILPSSTRSALRMLSTRSWQETSDVKISIIASHEIGYLLLTASIRQMPSHYFCLHGPQRFPPCI